MNIHQEESLCLVVRRGFAVVARQPLAVGVVKIGSDPSSSVVIDDASVAPLHAVIEVGAGGELIVADMGSDLGTRLNGRPIRRSKVVSGDQITLGAVTAVVEPVAAVFAVSPFAPTIASAVDAVWSQDAEPEDEPGAEAVDVRILWGSNVLHFSQLSPPRPFTLGSLGCDFALPGDGTTDSWGLVVVRDGQPHVAVPATGSATVRLVNGATLTLAECESKGYAHRTGGAGAPTEVALPHGATAAVRLAGCELVFEVSHVRAGAKPVAAFWEGADLSAQIYTGMSALVHATLIGALAFFLPGMHGDDAEAVDRDVAVAMKPYLDALAEKEPEREESVVEAAEAANNGGGRGSQAEKEPGTMGSQLSRSTQPARYAIQGDTPDPKLARERALLEAANFGMVGILNTDGPASANAPVAVWGADTAVGHDSKSMLGGLWGGSTDEMFGAGGLGISGVGEGGGGKGTGIGIEGIGDTVGHGRGDLGGDGPGHGPGGGFGPPGIGGHGPHGPPGHLAVAPNPRQLPLTVFNGTLPKEVVQRIVRQNFGRFRLCYEAGLRSNPGLTGRVAVAFVIDRNGAVSIAAADRSTDMADPNVVSCVVRGFQNLSFPAPADGTVQVVYPLMLAPDQ